MSTCINCSSPKFTFLYTITDQLGDAFKLHRCNQCSVCYLYPNPTDKQLEMAYNKTYYGLGESKFSKPVEKLIEWFRMKNASSFAKQLKKGAYVLDIGCGNGNFLSHLGEQGTFNLFGIEPEGKSAERASRHKKINLHKGYLEDKLYAEQTFDAIVLTHVFEHLPNPKETLDIINRISKAQAILQIEIPNIDSWQASFFKGNWFHLDPPRHLNMFPPSALKKELENRGWELISERYFSLQFNAYGAQQSWLNSVCAHRDILYEYLKENIDYAKKMSRLSLFCHQLFHWLSFPFFVMVDLIAAKFKKSATVKLVFKKKNT